MTRTSENLTHDAQGSALDPPLHALIEATQDAVIFIDRQARIVIFNPAAEEHFRLLTSRSPGAEDQYTHGRALCK